eukprot:jgi/Psemu1/248068/estExt_Genewise1.C_14820002
MPSISTVACTDPTLSTLCEVLQLARVDTTFNEDGTYTLFAPSNEAFERLASDKIKALEEQPFGELTRVLLYHTADQIYYDDELECNLELDMLVGTEGFFDPDFSTTVCNNRGKFQVGNGNVFGSWPKITRLDIAACNGVVHVVDNVLLPSPIAVLPEP